MSISKVAGQMLQSNLNRAGQDLTISNANVEISGPFTVGNVTISNIGNIDTGNVNINNLANPVANYDAVTKIYVDNLVGNGVSNIGNLTVSNTTISTAIANANIFIDPDGTGTFTIVGTNGFVVPVGNVAQRPGSPAAGTLRFNSEYLRLEYYDGSEWDVIAGGVTNETFNGDGSTLSFNLSRQTTAAALLVMLNGVVQVPTAAYSITGAGSDVLTFTEAPATGDVIDVRYL